MRFNLRTKTILVIVFVCLLSLVTAGLIINWRVNIAFDDFLQGQVVFFRDRGWPEVMGVPPMMEFRADSMHIKLEAGFKEQVWKGLVQAALMASIAAMMIGLFMADRITAPLKVLVRRISRLKQHDYNEKVELVGDEEIREVARSFEELREELYRVEELRKNAISDMAHEITTPLQSMLGMIEGLEAGIYRPEDKIEDMKAAISRMTRLVDDMREFSYARAKTRQIVIEKINLGQFVQTELAALFQEAEKKGLKTEISIKDTIEMETDRKILAQTLANLLKNAINYTTKGKIAISAERNASDLELSIKDTGCGISEQDLPLIFERFYRGDKSRSQKTGGTGLGLSIVKEYADMMNWEIKVESEEGKGSLFRLVISE